MKLHLVVAASSDKGRVIPIAVSPFMIGRHPTCELRPSSRLVSNRHCSIWQRAGTAIIQDFKSTNGTLVNGERVVHERELHNGDELRIGPLTFAVRIEASTAVDEHTPIPRDRSLSVEDAAALILREHCTG
jgi:pSer/pThr/pTyr-binding forkhead associated (FHA) protein